MCVSTHDLSFTHLIYAVSNKLGRRGESDTPEVLLIRLDPVEPPVNCQCGTQAV